MRVVWLLDVDGVLNASQRPGWSAAPRNAYAHCDGMAWKIRWAPALVREILQLRATYDVDVRWASTWCQPLPNGTLAVRQIESLLGFPQLLPGFETFTLAQEAKIQAAIDVLAAGDALIWTDDDAIPQPGDPGWHPSFLDGSPRLFISPDPRRGLQPRHIQAITQFLQQIRTAS